MKPALILAQVLSAISICWAQSPNHRHGSKPNTTSQPTPNIIGSPSRWYAPLSNASRTGKLARSLQRRCRTNAVNAHNRSATRGKRPVQCRSERFRGRALPRMADATVS